MNNANREIPIFFSTDDHYIPFLDVAIRSLIANASREFSYRLIVLNTGLDAENVRLVKQNEEEGFTIDFLDISEQVEQIKPRFKNVYHFSVVTYYRLFIASLFPQYDKVVYLDCDLVVLGDISFEQVVEWAEKWFGTIPAKGYKRSQLPAEPRQLRARRKTVYRSVPENALYMAFHMGGRNDSDYYACDLISDILSNGYSGRLLTRLVKEKKLFSKIDAFISGSEHPGLFWIYSRVAQGVSMETAEAAIWEELDELKKNEVPAEEIEKVKNRFESEFYFRNLGGENLAGNLAIAELRGDAHLHLMEVERYRAVTAADVRSIAKELFRRGNSSVLYYKCKE